MCETRRSSPPTHGHEAHPRTARHSSRPLTAMPGDATDEKLAKGEGGVLEELAGRRGGEGKRARPRGDESERILHTQPQRHEYHFGRTIVHSAKTPNRSLTQRNQRNQRTAARSSGPSGSSG